MKVIVTDHPSGALDIERRILAPLGADVVVAPDTSAATLAAQASGADALMVCFAPVPREVVEAAARGGVRIIARYGIGYDNVDVAAAEAAGIVVTNVPDYCLEEVADHTMALLLASARQVVPAARAVSEGAWPAPSKRIHRLRGGRLALVGVGGIGRRVADRARAFGLDVVAYDPFLRDRAIDGITLVDELADALRGADFVSLHVPMSAENRHLVNDATLALMDARPVLINTSRGGLVDLDAVTRALVDDRLGGVALDVTDPEPLPQDHPLRTHPQALVTPHVAFHSREATDELQRRVAEEVARVLRGEAPQQPVNRPR